MKLSSNVAEQIVAQLSQVMEPNINIMDMNGLIISSTDPVRIGTIHGGAVKIIEENLDELIIQSDTEYEGARNGINLPIQFNNEIIGVIGLTGKIDEVRKYGQIIKKMTEVLLLDTYAREQKTIEQKAKERFLEDWVFGRYDINYPQEFRIRAETLGIDTKTFKRVMVFAVRDLEDQAINDQIQTDISHYVREIMRNIGGTYFFRTSTLFIGIMRQMNDDEIEAIAKLIQTSIEQHFGCKAYIGIDNNEEKPIKASFRNANNALQVSLKSSKTVNIYTTINLDFLINSMIAKNKLSFLQEFFHQEINEEVTEHIHLIRTFYECDGSIQEASEKLFIHKNTLQYRLNKITALTGYDPRKISFAYLFTLAIKVFDSLETEKD